MRIEAKALCVDYGSVQVLNTVSVALQTGELVGLIGPNGAGKSTLLRALIGLQSLSSGCVIWNGMDVSHIPRQDRAKSVAYLAQKQNADWPLRVDDVVMLGRLPHRAPFSGESDGDRHAVKRALAAVDMQSARDRVLDHLSGGERARVLLARALAVEAPLLFADEPVAALDPLHQLRVMDLLQDRVRRGEGVVAVLHDLALAMRYCDRLIVMDKGAIRMDGPPSALTDTIIAEVYGVEVHRETHQGQDIVIPWRVAE